MELVQQLKEDGKAKGLCRMWQMKLKEDLDYNALINLYIRGIDFCIKNDYPTLGFIREHFKGKCEAYGVFVDEQNLILRDMPNVVLHGGCKGTLSYGGFSVCHAIIRHNTNVTIKVFGNACVTIDVFDEATLNLVVVGTMAKVLVYRYGNSVVNYNGSRAKIVFKNKNTY